jgi:serine/threonine protein kinase
LTPGLRVAAWQPFTLATHRNGLKVALKVLHPEHLSSIEVTSRFAREGRIANGIDHPGIVRVLDDDVTEDGRPFIVMELLRGELLEERRVKHGGQLSITKAIAVGVDILDVLSVAHAKQVIHRDIKPENIFITQDNVLKVLDFGIARIKQTLGTATGLLLGTADFMAPEQALGKAKQIDERTDVWGVGASLFVLLTAQPVHQGTSIAEVIRKVSGLKARSIGSVMPGLPAALIETVDRSLRFERSERWQSAREMQDALADCLRILAKERLGGQLTDAIIQTQTHAEEGELVTVRKPKGEVTALRLAMKTLTLETDAITVKERMPSALWRDLDDDEDEHTIREEVSVRAMGSRNLRTSTRQRSANSGSILETASPSAQPPHNSQSRPRRWSYYLPPSSTRTARPWLYSAHTWAHGHKKLNANHVDPWIDRFEITFIRTEHRPTAFLRNQHNMTVRWIFCATCTEQRSDNLRFVTI